MFARSKPRPIRTLPNASGDATQVVSGERAARSGSRFDNLNTDLERISEIARASISLSKLAPELAELSVEMAEGAKQQAADARVIADQAISMSVALEEAIDSLKISSSRIGGIVHAIKKLADQSKILAINAAIEAAKAGRAGYAFGAVAVEVESLASRTSSATSDVGEKVAHIEGSIQKAVIATGLDNDGTQKLIGKGNGLSIRGIGDRVRSIASVAQQHSTAASSVAETGESVRALCDRLLMAVGAFRLNAHRRASLIFDQIARSGPMEGGSVSGQERYLAERIRTLPMFELFYLTDRKGIQLSRNIWADTSRDGNYAVGMNWASRPWFLNAASNPHAETIISDIYKSEATGSYCFTVSKLIVDRSGKCLGVLAGDVNFAAMLEES